MSNVDARPRRVASPSSSSTRSTPGASARLRSAAGQWSPCTRFSTLAAGRRVRLAHLASSDQAELLPSPSSVCLDGVPMLATGRGLYFEHVSRMGSVLTAVQRRRPVLDKYYTESIFIYSRYLLPPPGHPHGPLCVISRPHDLKPARGGRTDVCAVQKP
jgi:hypothetical protein